MSILCFQNYFQNFQKDFQKILLFILLFILLLLLLFILLLLLLLLLLLCTGKNYMCYVDYEGIYYITFIIIKTISYIILRHSLYYCVQVRTTCVYVDYLY